MINNLVELRDGWHWPKTDINCWKFMQTYPNVPELISEFVSNKGTVVQAGGNCGFYVKKYAELFDSVYTFEPDWLNFYCLVNNVPEENVIKTQACLGNESMLVNLAVKEVNRGKNFIKGNGIYPVYKIDNIGLTSCDLIHLDIEGFEYFALLGAIETIKKFKPVIAVEIWDQLTDRFIKDANLKLNELLLGLGYAHKTTIHDSDYVYIPL